MATFNFNGTVVDPSGEPQATKLVTVYRKTTLRDYDARQPTATTDPSGAYTIGFTWNDVEIGDFEIVVTESVGPELGRSVVLLELGDGTYQVDIVTGSSSYRGRSEYHRIELAVSPLAHDGATPIPYKDLLRTDIGYLANKAGYPPSVLSLFIHAHRMTELTTGAVPANAFFAMMREGLPRVFSELLAQGPKVHRAALDSAVARNIIDDPGTVTLDNYIASLDAAAIDSAVWFDLSTGDKSRFRQMIDSANRSGAEGSEPKQRAFLAKYAAHTSDLDSFWTAVINNAGLGQDVHDTYKWSLQVQALCNGHQDLIDALQAKRNDGSDPVDKFEDLATIDVDGWKTLINSGIGVPDSIPQEWDEADRVQRYAETVARLVSDAVPTRVVHERIKRDNLELSGADDLDTFFTDNPTFDLRSDVLQRYLAANLSAFDSVPTTDNRRDTCKDNVKTIQRLSYVAQRGSTYDTIKPLYKAGVRSAGDIDAMGPIAFVRRFADDFGEGATGKTRAKAIYDRASHIYSITLALMTQYSPTFGRRGPKNVVDDASPPSEEPELEALFNSMDYCGCEHCRSVYSPAAYMVDLLQFLRHQHGDGNDDALTLLQDRRPDITKIDLTCANATTPLPYIDLVNELLETRVSSGPAPGDDYWQTTWTAPELALRPERGDAGAYTELVAAAYPWNLPFDLPRTESDIYLAELGVPRHAVLEAFATSPNADALARARLGLSLSMATAMTDAVAFPTLDCWGGSNAAALDSIAKVLDASGHSFGELQVLIGTEFVGTGLTLTYADFPDDCNLDLASITGLSDPHLERWHRFVRLQRTLDWTPYQLDAAIRALMPTPNTLDMAFLQRLGAAKAIGERLGIGGFELLSLWAPIELATPPEDPDAPSDYARLFLRRTLVDDPSTSNFRIAGTDLDDDNLPMTDESRLTVVMAALGTTSAELSEIIDWIGLATGAHDDTHIEILSAARRRIVLARALGVSIAELRRLVTMTGLDPFHEAVGVVGAQKLQDTIDFLDAVEVIQSSSFSPALLDYILFHEVPLVAGVEPDLASALALLGTLDDQINSTIERHALVADPTGVRLRDALSEYMAPTEPADLVADATRLDDLMALILATTTKTKTEQEDLIDTEMAGFLTPAEITTMEADLVGDPPQVPPALTDTNARIDAVLTKLLPWLEARARRAVTIQILSQGLGLSLDVGDALLTNYLTVGIEEFPLVQTFEAGGNLDGAGNPTQDASDAFVRLYKAGALVLGHDFDAVDLAYLYGDDAPEPTPWLDLNDLETSAPTSLSLGPWLRLAAAADARKRLPDHPDLLETLRGRSNINQVDVTIAERSDWRKDDVAAVMTALGYTDLTDFDDELAFLAIVDALELVDQTGVSASQLHAMTTTPVDVDEAASRAAILRQSLRARHGEGTWASTGNKLRDGLREQQRLALVGYLIANGDGAASFADENDLYAHYLLDVEMSACAVTTRIKLALSSIQLFAQRVFLNLEGDVEFDADAAVQYRWMKNYRVWEANRKVFLYPENYVEPELRQDKSALYAELEAKLAEDEPSEKLTERAFMGYLAGLGRIAKPEVMGIVRERNNQSGDALVDRLHVVARTRGEPHVWLYRTREDQREWTSWVTLDAQIEGDHVLPVVFNGRLYILWVTFILAGDEISEVSEEDEGTSGVAHVEVRLNWIERRFGEWSPTRVSPPFKSEEKIPRWRRADYMKGIRLSTSEFLSTASGRMALEVAVRRDLSDANDEEEFPEGGGSGGSNTTLWGIGRFVLEATDDEFTAQDLLPDGAVAKQTFHNSNHAVDAQSFTSTSDSPLYLKLDCKETRTPYRTQIQTLFDDPPQGYSLMFDHTDPPIQVQATGFFFRDRWRSLFIEPRDVHKGGKGTLNDANPGKIGDAPFPEQGGIKVDPPGGDPAPKAFDVTPKLLNFDKLQVYGPNYNGLAGILGVGKISDNKVAAQKVDWLAKQENDDATEIYDQEVNQYADHDALPWEGKHFRAHMFEHPYTDVFVGQIRLTGVSGLLAPADGEAVDGLARQQLTDVVLSEDRYDPQNFEQPYPDADIDFSPAGSYSIYNWELFLHAPVLLAKRLTANQRFDEAERWLRRIFDPTASDGEAPARYWRIKPFFDDPNAPSIHQLLLLLHYSGTDEEQLEAREAFEHLIWRWRRNPFDPHLIARFRNGTYQRAVVMQYLDNLIAWGDSLFARDTIESINEATQLYIMAQNILGPRPVEIDPHGAPEPKNYEELESGNLDAFSNAIVELENYTQGSYEHSGEMEQDANSGIGIDLNSAQVPHTWYFCVPPNPKLLGYWDTVADRLHKIRNCQNLEGIERKLALFQPPLDPAALVAAAALAGDFTSALATTSGRAPTHRFRVLLAKSLELAGEVRGLGSTLLRALESRDSAKIAQLRATQEPTLLRRVRATLELRLEHAQQTIETLEATRNTITTRRSFYADRLVAHKTLAGNKDTDRSTEEQLQRLLMLDSAATTTIASETQHLSGVLSMLPNFQLGLQGLASSPVSTFSWGSSQLASSFGAQAGSMSSFASALGTRAQMSGLEASLQRRREDWEFQVDNADRELEHLEAQKVTALTQVEIAKAELAAHDKRVANAEAVEAFMLSRYTNEELYIWMGDQVKQVYKQAYNLAFRMALATEQAYRFELQRDDSFIGYEYWDQAHAGLLAGDLLVQDLRRMDAGYIDNWEREYELTKVVSLAQVDPYALATLRQNGSAYFTVPEWIYDLDHPGQIRRRIKSVSVALPAAAGPHIGGGCSLTLESSKMRIEAGGGSNQPAQASNYGELSNDGRFVYRYGQVERIVTSSGRDSTGLFEPNLQGPRYLPFEGAGAISTWRVELPAEFRQFDYESIGDVLLTIRYTAREGGTAQASAALDSLKTVSAAHDYVSQNSNSGAAMMLRASVDFADEWYAFLREEHGNGNRTFSMDLDASRFPRAFADRSALEVSGIRMVLATSAPTSMSATMSPAGNSPPANFATLDELGGHMLSTWAGSEDPGTFTLSVTETEVDSVGLGVTYDSTHTRFDETKVRDLLIVVFFKDDSP